VVDTSGLKITASSVAVADGGTLLTVTGRVVVRGTPTPTQVDLLFFRKGPVVFIVYSSAYPGSNLPGQTLGLAQKIAARL